MKSILRMADRIQQIHAINKMNISQIEKSKMIFQLLNPKKESKIHKPPHCHHYSRKYYLIANCCKKAYGCRFCHNDNEDHTLNRKDTKQMKCTLCLCVFDINKKSCQNSECYNYLKPESYFCDICNLWFSDKDRNLVRLDSQLICEISKVKECYHCDKCGICRVGRQKDYKHCDHCNLCLHINSFDTHNCVKNVKDEDCPICLNNIWDSHGNPHVMKCGHTVHLQCFNKYLNENNYQCPLCKKSMIDMTMYWKMIDSHLENQQVPEDSEYSKWKTEIHCNDCLVKNTVKYDFVYHKCPNCSGYNTVVDNIIKK